MTTADKLYVTVHAQTAWLRALVRVAQMLARVSPHLALLWLRLVRPVCFIRICLDMPGHPGRWHFQHMPIADGLRVKE